MSKLTKAVGKVKSSAKKAQAVKKAAKAYFTPAEIAAMKSIAKKLKISLSEYIRQKVTKI